MTPPVTENQYQRLARAVRLRRNSLRLRQADLAANGGISEATVKNIEHASRSNYSGHTMSGIEEGLGWARGTVGRILNDDVPDWDEITGARSATTATRPTLSASAPAPAAEMTGSVTWPDRLRLGIELLVVLRGEDRTEATVALEATLRAWLAEQLGVDEQHVRAMLGTA